MGRRLTRAGLQPRRQSRPNSFNNLVRYGGQNVNFVDILVLIFVSNGFIRPLPILERRAGLPHHAPSQLPSRWR